MMRRKFIFFSSKGNLETFGVFPPRVPGKGEACDRAAFAEIAGK